MFSIALTIFIFLNLGYFLFASAIIYHLEKYRIEHDLSRSAEYLFIFVSLLLLGIAGILFFTTPWNELILP